MSQKPTSLVLLSGGLDSAANLALAKEVTEVKLALFISYGQRAMARERRSSQSLAQHYSTPWHEIALPFLGELGGSALTDVSAEIPQGASVDISSQQISEVTAAQVWVPNRNGLFLAVAACVADRQQIDLIIPGFNREEAQTFPDNSLDFLKATDQALSFSTRYSVRTLCLTATMDKMAIIERLAGLQFPFAKLWPCYQDRDHWCGECESCLRFKRALALAKPNLNFKELSGC